MLAALRKHPVLAVLLLASFSSFVFQGTRGLFESTEGRYALCAQEMLHSGNWLEPSLFGAHHWTKPPLAYWAMAAGMKIFGENPWGLRFFSSLAFVLTALIAYDIGRRLWDERSGWLCGLIYASCPFAIGVANSVNTDSILALFMGAAVWSYVGALTSPRSTAWSFAFWSFFGLAFLTKGPPALLVLFVPVLMHFLSNRRPQGFWNPPALLLGLILAFSWFIIVMIKNAELVIKSDGAVYHGLMSYYWENEIVGRIVTGQHKRNSEWYGALLLYPPLLAFGLGFWAWPQWRFFLRRRLWTPASWKAARQSPVALLFACWILPAATVFFLSSSRLPNYILPLFLPLALIAGREIATSPQLFSERRLAAAIAFTLALAALGKLVAAGTLPRLYSNPKRDMSSLYRMVEEWDQPGKTSKVEKYTSHTLAEALRQWQTTPSSPDLILIFQSKRRKEVDRALDAAGLKPQAEKTSKTWSCLRLHR
ncbi:MAG: hypothetical protein RL095_2020 [Verrucomicrobiota bacterium]